MYNTLKSQKLAHCNIKGRNIALIEGKLKIIEADNLTPFGQQRTAFSDGHNISEQDYKKVINGGQLICNEMTDYEGFQKLKEYVTLKGPELEELKERQEKFLTIVKLEPLLQADKKGSENEYNRKTETLNDIFFNTRKAKEVDILFI